MLKFYADFYRLREKTITRAALRRTIIFGVLSLPFFPLSMMDMTGRLPDFVPSIVFNLAFLVTGLFTFVFMFSRFVNRFYARDKYLDEWERRIKHESMAFAFQTMLYLVFALVGIGITLSAQGIVSDDVFDLKDFVMLVFILAIVGLYVQSFHALTLVKPMEADEA